MIAHSPNLIPGDAAASVSLSNANFGIHACENRIYAQNRP